MNRQYNRWLFNETWSSVIAEVSRTFTAGPRHTGKMRRPRKPVQEPLRGTTAADRLQELAGHAAEVIG